MSSTTVDADQVAEIATKPRAERVERWFGWEPFDYQADLLNHGGDTVQTAVKPGRQVGKTETGGAIAADAFVRGSDVMILGPFEDTVTEMMEAFKAHINEFRELVDAIGATFELTNTNKMEYEAAAGGRVRARTVGSSGTQIRGKNPDVVLVDEAAYIKNAIFTEVIEPFFSTHDEWEYYLFSTPAGKTGYFYEQVTQNNDFYSPHWPSSISPLISEEFLEKKRRQLDSITFAQEYQGEFVDEGETLFSFDVIQALTDDVELQGDVFLGVDVAREGTDRTVYAAIDEHGGAKILDSEETSTMDGVLGRIKDLHREHDFAEVVVEENSMGGGVVDFGADLSVISPFKSSTKSKHQLYKQLQRDIEGENLTLPNHRRLIDELTSLQYEFTQHSYMKVSHPEGGHDDHCFVADTPILTPNGEVPIKDLEVGDMVVTRSGPKPITGTSQRDAEVISRFGLTGTPDHPFITPNGILRFDNVTASELIYTWNAIPSCTTATHTTATQSPTTGTLASTTGHTQRTEKAQRHSTARSGVTPTEQSPMATSSTTTTATAPTTTLRTLSAWLAANISPCTSKNDSATKKRIKTSLSNCLKRAKRLLSGMGPKKAKNGTRNNTSALRTPYTKSGTLTSAKNAVMNTLRTAKNALNTAPMNASKRRTTAATAGSTMKPVNATTAAMSSPAQSTKTRDSAHGVAERKRATVHNISVAGSHEYFANGILVHNCDALAFANWGRNGGSGGTVTRRSARATMHKGK